MALTPEQLEEVRKELAARMGGDSTYQNPRTEGAGFMGFGTKTDPLLGDPSPSDNLPQADTGSEKLLVDPAGVPYQTQPSGGQRSKMNADILKNMPAFGSKNSFGVDTTLPDTSGGANFSDGSAPFGSTGGAEVTGDSYVGGQIDAMDSGSAFGGGWMPAAAGAFSGAMQGHQNYNTDPKMHSKEDGFGAHHRDYRAELGGGTLGGVLGYFGGPVGAAVAGPVVKEAHPYGERLSRNMVREGDNIGGAGGALMLDPVATVGSGKYSWGDLGKGALFGPAQKWFNF